MSRNHADITLTCESIDSIKADNFESMRVELTEVPLEEILALAADECDTDDIIEAVGLAVLLDEIGREKCIEHFGIEEAE